MVQPQILRNYQQSFLQEEPLARSEIEAGEIVGGNRDTLDMIHGSFPKQGDPTIDPMYYNPYIGTPKRIV